MKKLLLSAAVLLFTTAAFAQTTRIGIKGGVNLSKYNYKGYNNDATLNGNDATLNDNTKDNIGFNLTGFADLGVAKNFYVQPGISLQNKGTKWETVSNGVTFTQTDNTMTIDIPVNAVYSIPTGNIGAVQLSAGPYIGFSIAGERKNVTTTQGNTVSDKRDLKFGSTTNDDVNALDYGANFGLAYRLNSGFLFGANYGLGLSNLTPKDSRNGNEKVSQRVLGFSVGFSF